MSITILHGDVLDELPKLADNSIDSIVTDPPYALGFMGKKWDTHTPGGFQHWCELWARECLRVLKPGGHLVAFGGTRTYHRLTAGIEDAGFEIRDSLHWLYGSGFPKSADVSKAIDKAGGNALAFRRFARAYAGAVEASALTHSDIDRALGIKSSSCYWAREDHRGGMPPRHHWERVRDLLGLDDGYVRLYDAAEREVVGTGYRVRRESAVQIAGLSDGDYDITAPATDEARRWQGWGTALKPAHEPIVLARKPLAGTVAGNVQAWGTGALNIDGCRVPGNVPQTIQGGRRSVGGLMNATGDDRGTLSQPHEGGRWPANVVLSHVPLLSPEGEPVGDACVDGCVDGCQVAALDAQSGERRGFSTQRDLQETPSGYFGADKHPGVRQGFNDTGGASRFFPVFRYQAKASSKERPSVNGVKHPTVKPLALMQWLTRLVTPPAGTVLDPFSGSGTTLQAAQLEGFSAVGIERETEYLPLIEARLGRVA